jgi:hypothetical protein
VVPYGTATMQERGYWDDEATGGHMNYACSEYWQTEPEKTKTPEPRKDPKMWKIWFREFLTAILPAPREVVAVLPDPIQAHRLSHRCRSAPPPECEWKMKNWVQALKSQ